MNEPWISVTQIAAHSGVGRNSIYRWIKVDMLPSNKTGFLRKFSVSGVEDWVRHAEARDNDARKRDGR